MCDFLMLLIHQQAGAHLEGKEIGSEDATCTLFAFQRTGFGLALVWSYQVSIHQQLPQIRHAPRVHLPMLIH